MENLFKDMYWSLDRNLLYAAQRTVDAWNWTTGKRKTDLANTVLTVSPLTFTAGAGMAFPPLSYLLALPVFLFSKSRNDSLKDINKIYEKIEDAAKDNGELINPENMFLEGKRKSSGLSLFFGLSDYSGIFGNNLGVYLFGTAFLLDAAEGYIMRTDDPPAGKSVFSRAKDKLVEKVNSIKIPSPEPLPNPSPGFYPSYSFMPVNL